ncbi:MAG: SDR family oxidoreductase [Paludibacteraceae bacterium]|nr:SDR family oxidoreductase [Paludibacteraceae bacterium]
MRALFIGGTGTISMAITRLIAQDPEWELFLLNRGNRTAELPANVKSIVADINDEKAASEALKGMEFDVVCDFICFHKEQIERDFRLFNGKTRQFMVISSASAYQKPLSSPYVSEATPLANPYWKYSREKIEIEEYLIQQYRENGFPITIVRPSHTYDERSMPLGVHGKKGSYQVIKRMLEGKPVIIHGDGTSLWTMTHNSDFAKGFVGLMGNPHALGESFQITSDETLTWNQIYQSIAAALHVELKPYYISSAFLADISDYDFTGSLIGDKANSAIFCNEKLKRAVPGLQMNVRFEQGIRKTIKHILAHPELQVEDPEFDAWCDKVIDALEQTKKIINNG